MANEAGVDVTGAQGPLGLVGAARAVARGKRLRRLSGERSTASWNAPLRPSGPIPPSAPARRPVPVRPSGPVPPRTPAHPARPAPAAAPEGPALPQAPAGPATHADPATRAYLRDYAALMDAVPLPSVLFDRRWDVLHANPAYDHLFRGVGPHPSAMPQQNFLRFVLFHPDAPVVLAEHETSWCLPLMAQLAAALEAEGQEEGDERLMAVRDDIALDPIMDAAYRCGLPLWVSAVGADGIHHDGAVRPVYHPDPRWGRTDCRIVDETPARLQGSGCTRITFVLRENRSAAPGVRHGKAHLRAVSGG
ncbi:transcriptional regulator [Streptomyces sp. NPDC005805]|uniref:MmyB family transcriptional regulator n=1 Tax=Streptomyces sp. NPDC005805 TaxID=3157068 RepID=UPI0033EA1FF9